MNLLYLKMTHVSCVAASYVLFLLRGIWMMRGSSMLNQRWVKVLPHVTDTLLFVSAAFLAFGIQQYPGVHAWLTAKVAGLLVYITFGMIAFRVGKTMRTKISAWFAAQAVYFYIIAVAITHNPLPFTAS